MNRRVKEFTLLVVSTLVAVFAAEGVARVFVSPAPRFMTGFRLSASGYYMEDSETGWRPRPGVAGVHNQEGSFESSFSTNSLGLRDDESVLGPRNASVRIVALGDSFTWGFGVDDDQIYTAVMEELDPRIEVVNLGVTAFGLRQQIAYLERLGPRFQPDIVIQALVMNDITDPLRIRPGETVDAWMDRIGMRPRADLEVEDVAAESSNFLLSIGRIKPWLADHSVLYRIVTDVINTNKTLVNLLVALGVKGEPAGIEGLDSNLRPFLAEYPETVVQAVEAAKEELRLLDETARSLGARLLVVVVPALQSVDRRARENSIAYTRYYDGDFDLDKPYRLIEEFGKEAGIPVLNTVDAIRAAHSEGEFAYLRNDMHFNSVGHKLFAEQIVGYLTSQGWVP